MQHPIVDIIWNFWPVSMIVITPLRVSLNIIFFPIYFFTWWTPLLWNFIFENMTFCVNLFIDFLAACFLAFAFVGCFFLWGYTILWIALGICWALVLAFPLIYTIPS